MTSRRSWTSKEALEHPADELSNEDIILRYDYQQLLDSFEEFTLKFSPTDVLNRHIEIGRYSRDELKAWLAEIEADLQECTTSILSLDGDDDEKTRLEKYKEILKRVLTYGWNKFTREEKRKTRIIFDYYGFEFGDIDKEKQEDISREFISINIHEDCRKYKMAGDNYFFDFSNTVPNNRKDYCLSIGSCSFYPFKQDSDFRYDIYMRYLAKTFNLVKEKGIIFSPSTENRYREGTSILNETEIIDSKWIHNIPRKEITHCLRIWDTFKYFTDPIRAVVFKARYSQSLKLQSMNESTPYAILTFGQFQEIYGFFMSLIFKKGEKWNNVKKFGGYIFRSILECKFNSDYCDKQYIFLIDALHQIVIFKSKGQHGPTCRSENQALGYQVYRNLFLQKIASNSNDVLHFIKTEYRKCYATSVFYLGVPPTSTVLSNWRSMFHRRSHMDRVFKVTELEDYFQCVSLIKNVLSDNELITFTEGKYHTIAKDPNSLIHHFRYSNDDSDKKDQALIFSSKEALSRLMEADTISVDATFNMLLDHSIKFITVSYKSELDNGSEPRIFLGCLATLPGGETSRNYTFFFLQLRSMIKKIFGPSAELKAKTILTDESQAEMTGISLAFNNRVSVRNCVWHKRLTFERNLDVKGVKLATKAIYSITELECVNNLLLLILDYKQSYDEMDLKSRSNNNATIQRQASRHHRNTDRFLWKYPSRDRTKKHVGIKHVKLTPKDAKKLLATKIEYVYKALLTRERWAMYPRIRNLQLSSGILETLNHTTEEIQDDSTKNYSVLVEDVSSCIRRINQVLRQINSKLNLNINTESEKPVNIVENEEISSNGTGDADSIAIQLGSLSSTQASETIHSSLKYSHRIKNKKNMVLFTDAIVRYFYKQDHRMKSTPSRKRLHKNLQSMDVMNHLSEYKKSLFHREFTALMGKNYNIHKSGNDVYDLCEIEDFDQHFACTYCMKCRICNIPCKHVMSYFLYGMMIEHDFANKFQAIKLFVSKMDVLLMRRLFPNKLRKRKSKRVEDSSKRQRLVVGENLSSAGKQVARENEKSQWVINTLAEIQESTDIYHQEKIKLFDYFASYLEEAFPDVICPIMSDDEIIRERNEVENLHSSNQETGALFFENDHDGLTFQEEIVLEEKGEEEENEEEKQQQQQQEASDLATDEEVDDRLEIIFPTNQNARINDDDYDDDDYIASII